MDQRFTLRPGIRPVLRALVPGAVLLLIVIPTVTLGPESLTRLGALVDASAFSLMAMPSVIVASTRLRVDGATTIVLSTMGRITSKTSVPRGARIVEGTKGWHVVDADGRLQLDLGSAWDREKLSRLARHLGLSYENIAPPSSTTLPRPDGVEQLRLHMSPRAAARGISPIAVLVLIVSIAVYVADRSLASLFFVPPLAAVIVAWFYQRSRTFLLADAYSVRIHRPILPVKQISRQEIGMVTKSGKICDRAGRVIGTETPWTRDQTKQLAAFLGVPLVDDDTSSGG